MGFPLPVNPDVQTLAYYLVAIPDAIEYKRAVIGHFGELGNARVWGEEGITPDSFVAAQAWLRALNETWELIEMGWPQQILAAIDGVEALLAILQNVPQYQITCCNGNQTFADPPGGVTSGDPVPQAVVDAGYATSTSDYAGYADYKCMVAHLLINNFQAKTLEIIPIVIAGAAVLSVLLVLFGATSGLAALTIVGLTVGLGELLTLIDVVKDLTATDFQAFAQDLEDNRDDLVCAILSGDGINGSIAAYKAKLDELFTDVEAGFFKLLNVDHMFQHYLAAAYGNVDVAAELAAVGYDPSDFSCASCSADVTAFFTFPSDAQGWSDAGQRSQWDTNCDALEFEDGDPPGEWWCEGAAINAVADGDMVSGHTYRFRTVRYVEGRGTWDASPPGGSYRVFLADTEGGEGELHSTITPPTTIACNNRTVNLDVSQWPDFVWGGTIARIVRFNGDNATSVLIDNVLIELDDVTP